MSTRPEATVGAYLWDALNASRNVQKIVTGISIEHYVDDLLRESATERQMEIVGEALANVPRIDPVMAEQVPHVHKIIGMRNVLVHGYATPVANVASPPHSRWRNGATDSSAGPTHREP